MINEWLTIKRIREHQNNSFTAEELLKNAQLKQQLLGILIVDVTVGIL